MKLKKSSVVVSAILGLAVLFAACRPGPAETITLDGTRWDVVELNGQAVQTPAEGTLDFAAGRVTGQAFCNGFGGSYRLEGSALTFGELAQTLMACLEPADVMALESAYMAALTNVRSYRMDAGKLVLLDAAGTDLVVLSPAGSATLEGTLWQLTGYRQGDGVSSLVLGTEITATLADGTVSGTAGCNQYTAPYTRDGDMLTVGPAASTRMACMEPAGVMEQETAYLTALSAAATYAVERTRLTVYDAAGAMLLTFVATSG